MADNVFRKSSLSLALDDLEAGNAAALTGISGATAATQAAPTAGTRAPAPAPADMVPLFEAAARKYQVPVNILMAIAEQESSYNPDAVGPQTQWGTAKGLMQYLDDTAKGMGIDPLDPVQAIDAAAKQIKERLDKGYSMTDAVKEHFGGPDRSLWGPKTEVYGTEVMDKAGVLGKGYVPASPPAAGNAGAGAASPPEGQRRTELQQQLEAEAPGRYRVLHPEEADAMLRRPKDLRAPPPPAVPGALSPAGDLVDPESALGAAQPPAGEPAAGESISQNLAEFGKAIPGGAVGMVGTAIKGFAALDVGAKRRIVDVMNRVDAGESVQDLEDVYGYRLMGPEDKARFRQYAEQEAAGKLADSGIYRAGEDVSRFAAGILPAAPGYEDSVGRQLGQGVGSLAAGVAASLLPGAGPAVAATTFALSGSGEAVERAVAEGASEDQIIEAAKAGLIPGLTDSLPVEILLGRIPVAGKLIKVPVTALGAALRSMGKIGTQAFVEGVQEGGQTFLQNLIAKEIYKPDQDLAEGIAPSAAVGAGVGGIAEGARQVLMNLAPGHRGGVPTPPPAPPEPPTGPLARSVMKAAETIQAQQAAAAPPPAPGPAAPGGRTLEQVMRTVLPHASPESAARWMAHATAEASEGQTLDFKALTPEQQQWVLADLEARGQAAAEEKLASPGLAASPEPAPAHPVGSTVRIQDREGLDLVGEVVRGPAGVTMVKDEKGRLFGIEAGDPDVTVTPIATAQPEPTPSPAVLPDSPQAASPAPVPAPAVAQAPAPDPVPATQPAVATAATPPATEARQPVEIENVASWVREPIANAFKLGNRLDIINEIERLAAAGHNAASIAKELGARLDPVVDLARQNGEPVGSGGFNVKTDFVRQIRVGLGIPSLDQKAEFDAWRAGFEAKGAPAAADPAPEAPEALVKRMNLGAKFGKKAVTFQDKALADLFDFGSMVLTAHSGGAVSHAKLEELTAPRRKALAEALGIPEAEVFGTAADYRRAVMAAARDASGVDVQAPALGQAPAAAAPAVPPAQAIEEAAAAAATSPSNDLPAPTEAQKEAGNYQKGHVSIHGLQVSIENPKGSERTGKRPDGSTWSHTMSDHYGYIRRTEGADGEQVDVYLGPEPAAPKVYVVDQVNQQTGEFDEHKVMLGFPDQAAATAAYSSNFDAGWKVGPVTPLHVADFKVWMAEGDLTKPLGMVDRSGPGRGQKIGVNADGNDLYEDHRGARSYVEFGIRATEKVGIIPGGGYRIDKEGRGGEYLTPDEMAERAAKAPPAEPPAAPPQEPAPAIGEFEAAAAELASEFGMKPPAKPQEKHSYFRFADESNRGTFVKLRAAETALVVTSYRAQSATSDPVSGPRITTRSKDEARRVLRDAFAHLGISLGEPAAPAAPAPAAPAAPAAPVQSGKVDVVPVKDVSGRTHYVARAQLAGDSLMLRRYKKDGGYLERADGPLARENIAPPAPAAPQAEPAEPTAARSETPEALRDALKKDRSATAADGTIYTVRRNRDDGWYFYHRPAGSNQVFAHGPTDARKWSSDEAAERAAAYAFPAGAAPVAPAAPAPDASYGANNRFVTKDRAEELRQALKAKLKGQLNAGLDPELLSMGAQLAAYHLEAGARRFIDFARRMAADLDTSLEKLRPYLRAWYNGARDMLEDAGQDVAGMDSPEQVRAALNDLRDEAAPKESAPDDDALDDQDLPDRDAVGDGAQGGRGDEGGTDPDAVSGPADGASGPGDGAGDGEPSGPDLDRQAPVPGPGDGGADLRDPPAGSGGDRAGADPGGAGGPGRAGARGRGGRRAPKPGGTDQGSEPDVGEPRRPLSAPVNHRIGEGELKRIGSWRATAERNIQIVEMVKRLETEGRPATAEEKALLTRFTGWGASEIANGVFPDRYGRYKDGWETLGKRLEAALTKTEYEQARRSTQYAHYTSESVIRSIYQGIAHLGFAGGNILEPGMGVGLFNGMMPADMAAASNYTGIEFDAMTGAIAKLLYPASNILVQDYIKTKLPPDFFDAAIGNPPFSSLTVTTDSDYKRHNFMLHDYFFAKTIDRIRPGGLMVLITSKGTMDKGNNKARAYLADRADLLGAIRLPQTAFKENAGTEVVTDVIFLQRRAEGAKGNGVAWLGLDKVATPQGTAEVNEYFVAHPEMVMGRHSMTGSMYRANEYTVEPEPGVDMDAAFAAAVLKLPKGVYQAQRGTVGEAAAVRKADFDPKVRKDGGVYIADDGTLMQVTDGVGGELTHRPGSNEKMIALKPRERAWLRSWVGLRDALKKAQYDQLNDGDWQASLKALGETYDAFVERHGHLLAFTTSERPDADGNMVEYRRHVNGALFDVDTDGPLMWGMERITETGEIVKAPALTRRTIDRPPPPVIHTTQDALFVSLDQSGTFDIDKVAKLAGVTRAEAIAELGTEIYDHPGKGWVMADEYLSGDVVKRLAEAREAAKIDPKYRRNVEALLAVQPTPLTAAQITVRPGAAWIPTTDITDFAQEVMEEGVRVRYHAKLNSFDVVSTNARPSSEWGTAKMTPVKILDAVLNSRQIKVNDYDADGKPLINLKETEAALDVARKMREAFQAWIWADTGRTERLVTFYNENFNNIAPRKFDGSHLTLPGVSMRFNPRPHQKRAIWRGIQTGDMYLAHAVGAGKTFTMIAIGMEGRRLGFIRKPMYVVPNHMLGQFAREFLEAYPLANIMVADEQNFSGANRRRFVARAAINDPDAIIVTHSAFGRVGMSDKFAIEWIEREILEWQAALAEVDDGDRTTIKEMERYIEKLKQKLETKMNRPGKDKVLTFEETGVDFLFVDEIHEFRKLDFATNQGRVKGIDPNGSQRALDLHMKVRWLRDKNPGRTLVGASGTPITNTVGELFTQQRLFQPAQLTEDGLASFDAWAAQFGATVTASEQNAAGGYEMVTRFAKFQNVPELMRRVRSFMDILTNNDLGELIERPTIAGGSRKIVVTPPPDGFAEYQKKLQDRIRAIRTRGGRPQKGDDIILSVIGDGRFSAIDMRFVDNTRQPDPKNKLNLMLDDVIHRYKTTADMVYQTNGVEDPLRGAALMIFANIGLGEQSAKSRGFSMRDWMMTRLTEAGIPAEHIAFLREHKKHSEKERLFADMREGKKRILIGGMDMETGVNVQKRLKALYHLDAPWFPASMLQREGRIERYGNQNPEVEIIAYATKGSYDSTMWGMNARKQRAVDQAMSGDESVRTLEDVSEASTFDQAAALASGDERYMKMSALRTEVERLTRLRQVHHEDQNRLAGDRHRAEGRVEFNDKLAADLRVAIEKRVQVRAGDFSGEIDGKLHDARDTWSEALFERFKDLVGTKSKGPVVVGKIGGFNVEYDALITPVRYSASVGVDIPGRNDPLLAYPIEDMLAVSGLATRAVNQVNGMDRALEDAIQVAEKARRQIQQIDSRLGSPFPNEADLLDKSTELLDLEAELTAATKAAEEVAKAEAQEAAEAAATDDTTDDADEAGAPRYSISPDGADLTHLDLVAARNFLDGEPVATISGDDAPASGKMAALVEWAGAYLANRNGGVVTREDIGAVKVDRLSVKKSLGHGYSAPKVQAIYLAPDIVEQGIIIRRAAAETGPHDGDVLTLAAPVRIGTKDMIGVAMLRADANRQGMFLHEVVLKERLTAPPFDTGAVRPTPATRTAAGAGATETLLRTIMAVNARPGAVPLTKASLAAALGRGPLGEPIAALVAAGRVVLRDTVPPGTPPHAMAWTDPSGKIHLVASRLTQASALPVLLHEAFHSGTPGLLGTTTWRELLGRLDALYTQFEKSSGRARRFWDEARRRAGHPAHEPSLTVEEFGAYAVEAQASAPASLAKWVDDLIGRVKAWALRRFGRQLGRVTPAQLKALAIGALRAGTIMQAETNGSLRYSLATKENGLPQGRRPLALTVKGGLDAVKRSGWLPAIPLNYLIDYARPGMVAIKDYMRLKRGMDAYRGEKHAEYDAHAQTWLKFNGKHSGAAQALADLMHDATLEGQDPSVPYLTAVTPEDLAALKSSPRSAVADGVRRKLKEEEARKKRFAALQARYDALPADGKAMFRSTRDTYKAQVAELEQIIIDNVTRALDRAAVNAKADHVEAVAKINADKKLSAEAKAQAIRDADQVLSEATAGGRYRKVARLTRLREMFESNRVPDPYFPLYRSGSYFVTLRNDEGSIESFSLFESSGDQEWFAREAAKDASVTVEKGLLSNRDKVRGPVDPSFVAEIEEILGDANVSDRLRDDIWQRYLTTLPDLSMRKNFIHRKGTRGYSGDALRAFGASMFHAAHQMARLKFGDPMSDAIDDMRAQAIASDDPTQATMLVNEFEERHEWVMNPQGAAWAQRISSAAFIWNLAVSPAAAMVNMTQTPMLGIPVLGAHLGGAAKAALALGKASAQLATAKGLHLAQNKHLSAQEKAAMEEFYRLGLVDRTQSHDLAGVGDTGIKYSATRTRVMHKMAWLYHNAERINREVTALAAYRMAIAKGQDHAQAVETAADLTWTVHFDYTNSNRARYTQKDWQKVLLIHRQHNINITYRLFRDLHQTFKGESKEARRIARAQFAGTMGLFAVAAGALGLPFFGTAMMAVGLLRWALGDDDDRTTEDLLKKELYDALPTWLADTILYGVPTAATGYSLTNRIGLPDFFFRSPDRQLEGKDEAQYWISQILGAGLGIPPQIWTGVQMVADGEFLRGAESMVPKFVRDALKAGRYVREGVLTLTDRPLVDQVSAWEIIGQAIGFTPFQITKAYEDRGAKMNLQDAILSRRSGIMNRFALAVKMDDEGAIADVTQEVQEFNQAHPEVPLTADGIRNGLKSRMRNDARATNGVILDPRLEGYLEQQLGY